MKKKLKLDQLQVQSFVTEIEKSKRNDVIGGVATLPVVGCPVTTLTQQYNSLCHTCEFICEY